MKGVALLLIFLVIATSIAAGTSGVDKLKEQVRKFKESPHNAGHVLEFSSQVNVTHVGNVTEGFFSDGNITFSYVSRPLSESDRKSLTDLRNFFLIGH